MAGLFCIYTDAMKPLGLALACLAGLAYAETNSVQLARVPGTTARWTGNHLVDMQGSGTASVVFRIYKRDGSESRTVPLLIPGALHIAPGDFSMNASGQIAAVGTWQGAKKEGGSFLALIPVSGEPLLIDTAGYSATAVAIEKSGEIWTFGVSRPLRSLLREWDQSGEMTEFPLNPPEIRSPNTAQLEVTARGLYLYFPGDSRLLHIQNGIITADVQDIQLSDRRSFQVRGRVAVTDAGAVFSLSTIFAERQQSKQVIVRLDTSARRWVPIDQPAEDLRRLYGSDGSKLVTGTPAPFELKFSDLAP